MNKKMIGAVLGTLAFGTMTIAAHADDAPPAGKKADKKEKKKEGDKKGGEKSCKGDKGCSGAK
jgi:hypothetical protein